MKICLIESLGKFNKLNTLNSIKKEFKISKNNFQIYKEKSRREDTLNYILKDNYKNKEDIFVVADDIILVKGWKNKIATYKKKFDVFSFQTLYPNSNLIQDYGYDLINENNKIILKPKNRYKIYTSNKSIKSRHCIGLCGCLLYINYKTLKSSIKFSRDGMNRWSEFIYLFQLKQKGFKIGVISHPAYHNPISTKQKKNIKLSSLSYSLEKVFWEKIVKKYDLKNHTKKNNKKNLSQDLKNFLDKKKKLCVYGVGTISEMILKYKYKNIFLTSGLKEEIGKKIFNKKVYSNKELNMLNISDMIITAIGYEKEIVTRNSFKNKTIFFLNKKKIKNSLHKIGLKKQL